MKQEIKTISQNEMGIFVNKLIQNDHYEVVGVKSKGERFVFDELEDANELRLDYDVTILPPKKYFLPQYEKLMDFDLKKNFDVKTKFDNKPRIIIGVHPYDIVALTQTDRVYLDDQKDDFYKKRRENTIIIGIDIQKVSERSFSASLGTHITDTGFDLMLTNLGNKYAITIGSQKGKLLLNQNASTDEATDDEIKKIAKIHIELPSKYKKKLKVTDENELSSLLVANYENALWEERSDRCLECSSCTMVCPTCYCYDVKDEVSLNLEDGTRLRTWDGCLLRDFTKVGSGEVFRDEIKDRYRHRFFRKGNYLTQRYGFIACVGCGRCSTACLPDIADPCDVINELHSFGGKGNKDKFFLKQQIDFLEKGTIHVPRKATITRIEKLTDSETLYEIELDDKKPLGHKPGQFVELSLFGIGEAPFGISTGPSQNSKFELVVRKVGNLTSKLATLKVGDSVGIRGPLGNGFDVKSLEGKHLLFVSGGTGIIPMRSLIEYCLDKKNRDKFKYIKILYGAKRPCEVLFQKEINEWEKCLDVSCRLTVDTCSGGECWVGSVGLITTLFPKLKVERIDPKNTIAIVIGPPVMYKFVIKCLQTLGVPEKNILVSLERRMKCGVGKCGHCQINGIYVCREGPVFNYADIKGLPEAFE
ncbi:MAG: 4Fe-4S dicluster domain-containing protein [Candidatus Thermoplasmatota archaeon]|nr:4Fe-4S dicluster domain-containing protein [Candidatus Thermoplasmatota archaeon]